MGNCMKASDDIAPADKSNVPQRMPDSGAGKDRISDNDKAILDVKGRMRTLRTYEQKLVQQDKEATDKIKELIKAGQKERAIIHLKKKKFAEAETRKLEGAQIKLQETILAIESAQADLQVFAALKEGDAVIKDLHQKVSIADWEELYADHKENMEVREMEIEMFGEALNDDDLAAELDNLVADDVAGEIADPVGAGAISASDAAAYREEHGIAAPENNQAEPAQAAAPKRQMLAA